MKLKMLVIALTTAVATHAFAEDKKADTHMKEGMKHEMMENKMMDGKMDMEHMHAMMADCKKMHKDGKKCEGKMAEMCEKNMGKEHCEHMMKEEKAK